MQEPIYSDDTAKMLADRDAALQMFILAAQMIDDAQKLMEEQTGKPLSRDVVRAYQCDDRYREQVRRAVDRRMWATLLDKSGIPSLMGAETRRLVEKPGNKEPIEFCPSNVGSTLHALNYQRDLTQRQGIVDIFLGDHQHERGEPFVLGRKLTLQSVLLFFGESGSMAKLEDMERAFHILDGKPVPDYDNKVSTRLKALAGRYFVENRVELNTEYFRIKTFLNGNAHVWFLRADLVKQVTVMVNQYLGSLPEETAQG